jgi:hypothetical protein
MGSASFFLVLFHASLVLDDSWALLVCAWSPLTARSRAILAQKLQQIEEEEEKVDKEVEAARLKNMHYLNELDKLERILKEKVSSAARRPALLPGGPL